MIYISMEKFVQHCPLYLREAIRQFSRELYLLNEIELDMDRIYLVDENPIRIVLNFSDLEMSNFVLPDSTAILDSHPNIARVTSIDLNTCKLFEVPAFLLEFPYLESLGLMGNNLLYLPPWISEMASLTELWLAENELEEIPMLDLPSLAHIDLSDNNLNSLPYGVTRLRGLVSISLQNNMFERFPPALLQMSWLLRIDLSGNLLSSIPSNIDWAQGLTHLQIRDNSIETIPEGIAELKFLQELDLTDNGITQLPVSLAGIEHPCNLLLEFNPIDHIPQILMKNNLFFRLDEYMLDGRSREWLKRQGYGNSVLVSD